MNRGTFVLFAVILASSFILTSSNTMANESAVTTTSITVPISCTMQGTGMTHTATLAPNTYSGASGSEYENGIGKTTLTAICNDDDGFSIYAIGFTGNSYDSENHTKLVGSSTGGIISTKAYASGDTASNWSMKLIKETDTSESYNPQNLTISTGYDAWAAVPSSFTKVAEYHANTGSSTTDLSLGVKLETTYAAYIASNLPADTYVGQVKYTMVHPYNEEPAQPRASASGKICYYANAGNVDGTMGCQNVASSVTLLASNFSRTGYGFAGWSDKFDYGVNNEAHFYGPQEQLSIPDTSIYTGEGKGLSLYAVWVKSAGSIQDTDKVASLCGTNGVGGSLVAAPYDGTANLSSVSALTDQRDNQTYAIARLADGNCWMIENLRLESTNSDNSTGALAQGYGTSTSYGYFGGLPDAEFANFVDPYRPNSLYYSGTQEGTASIDVGYSNDINYRIPRYNNLNTQSRASNPTTNSFPENNTSGGMYSYGNYYSWAAAIADTAPHTSGTVSTTSICPSGWRLPIGYTSTANKSFGALSVALGGPEGGINADSSTEPTGAVMSARFRSYPNNYLYSGDFYTSSSRGRGGRGIYWSSTTSGICAYRMYINSDSTRPGPNYDHKYYGFAIRCVNNN